MISYVPEGLELIIKMQNEQEEADRHLPFYQQKINRWKSFVQSHFQIIRLSSKPYLLWNFSFFLTLYYSFLTNLFTIFIISHIDQSLQDSIPINRVNQIINIIFPIVDMLFVRWHVQRIDEEQRQLSHVELFKNYMVYYFCIDFLVVIVTILDVSGVALGFFRLLIYLKVFLFQAIKEEIAIAVRGSYSLQIIFKSVRLLTFVIFWSFFFACVFVMIDLKQLQQKTFNYEHGFLWIDYHPGIVGVSLYQTFEWYVWFEYALYFVLQMVRTCGMGNISPRSPLSMLAFSVANLTMTIIFWYFTDKVLFMIDRLYQKNRLAMNLINLTQMKQIKVISQKDYRNYGIMLKYAFTPQLQTTTNYKKLQELIPINLWKQFNYRYKQHFIQRFVFMKDIVGHNQKIKERFQKDLAQIVKSRLTYPGQIIIRKNQITEPKLYLCQKSHIIFQNQEMVYRQKLPEWSFIGTRQFFVDKKPLFDVFGTKVAAIDYIEKQDFTTLLNKYPKIKRLFRQKIDRILIDKESTQSLELKCFYCCKLHQNVQYHLNQHCLTARNINDISYRAEARQKRNYLRQHQNLDAKQNRNRYFNRTYIPVGKVIGLERMNMPESQVSKKHSGNLFYNMETFAIKSFRKIDEMTEMPRASLQELQQFMGSMDSKSVISY